MTTSTRPAAHPGAFERRVLPLLAELSQELARSLDLDRTLREAVERIASALQAEAAAVFLVEGERLLCRASAGPADIRGLSLRLHEGIVGRALAKGACQLVRDAQADPDFTGKVDARTGFITRSVLCAPLVTGDGPIGALQVLNKRDGGLFDDDDRDLLLALAAPTALALNGARMAQALLEQNRIKRELGMARTLQRALLPKRRRDGFPLRGLNIPAREISGDFYDHFELPDGRIGFTAGDVSGKGLDAAFLMVRCASLLRWVGMEGRSPRQWMEQVNDELCQATAAGMFVCAVVGYVEPASDQVVWANAGFPPALRIGRDARADTFEAQGPPLGILPGMAYPEQSARLSEASLYFFSDGVTDARAADGSLLGLDRIATLLGALATLPRESRLRRLVRSLRSHSLTDDTTLLLIETGPERLLQIDFEARPEALAGVRKRVGKALARARVEADLRYQLVLAVDEACSNIIRHAYRGPCDARIELAMSRAGRELRIELRDYAPCVDPARVRPRDLSECRPGGLGVALIDQLMDEWRLEPDAGGCGNRLHMRKMLPGDTEQP